MSLSRLSTSAKSDRFSAPISNVFLPIMSTRIAQRLKARIVRTPNALTVTILTLFALLSSCTLPPSLAPPKPFATPASPARPAGSVELYVMPDEGQQWLTALITSARRRVLMKIYLLSDDRIVAALKRARENGAEVRAMVEPAPFGGAATADGAFKMLQKAGVNTKSTSPAFRYTHEKSFVIDDLAVILTANMTRGSFSRNREFAVVQRDSNDVAEVVAAFEADWNRARFTPNSPDLVWSPVNARDRINALIESAQRSLMVYAASALDDQQIGLLVSAAQRGVDVRFLISPPRADSDDVNAADLDRLQRGRVSVRLLKSPYVHAKVFVADAERPPSGTSQGVPQQREATAFVGSVNITTNSLDFNRELGLIFSDVTAIQRIAQTFERDWSKAEER